VVTNCPDAAGAMFRLVVDLTTRPLLPPEGGDAPGLTSKVRRDLGLRLPWLFDNGLLPRELRELSHCIREDDNNGAHAAPSRGKTPWTSKISPSPLLERVFTERERLKLAEVKRAQRSSYAKASRFSPGISSIISSSSQRRSTFVRSLSARSASACTWPMPFAHDLGPQTWGVLHAARPRHGECLRRSGASVWRLDPNPRRSGRLPTPGLDE
jgi:hypothetical protein